MRIVYLETVLDDIVFRGVVNFFVTILLSGSAFGDFFLRYSSMITLSIPVSGIARMIPRTPPREAPASMTIKTRKGERSSALLITWGTRKSFSIRCMMR